MWAILIWSMSLYSAVTSSSWHSRLKKNNYTVQLIYSKFVFSKWTDWLSVWVSPRKYKLALNLLVLRKCTWTRCTDCLVLQFSSTFFWCCAYAAFWERRQKRTLHLGVVLQPHTGRGGTGAGAAQLRCISCVPLGLERSSHWLSAPGSLAFLLTCATDTIAKKKCRH